MAGLSIDTALVSSPNSSLAGTARDNTLIGTPHDMHLPLMTPVRDTPIESKDEKTPLPYSSPKTTQRLHSKLAHLDGLRGLAALWVWFIHFVPYISPSLLPFLLGYQKWNASVPIFFILSGRVITLSVLKSGSVRQLVSCIIRRPFRLVLPVISIMLLDYFFFGQSEIPSISNAILSPVWFLFDDSPRPGNVTYAIWTISYEYQLSNKLYVLTLLIMQFPNADCTRYAIMGLSFLWFQITHSWMTHFVAGLFLADLAMHGYLARFQKWRFAQIIQITVFLLSIAVAFTYSFLGVSEPIETFVCSILFHHGKQGVDNTGWEESFIVFVFCITMMFCIETSARLQWVLSRPVFVFLGHISFSLYLLHTYWIDMFAIGFNNYVNAVLVDWPNLAVCISLGVSTCMLALMSYLLVPIIDTPSVWAGKWVEQALTEQWTLAGVIASWRNTPFRLYVYVRLVLLEWVKIFTWPCETFKWVISLVSSICRYCTFAASPRYTDVSTC
ncbi:hypothetical protein BASA60_005399 [Batrachochytrium salamandrivorans]|nr:hypothetical protein BASA62_004125 [Batrachochytrium salamandrivorans]KAH6574634.1 hypothetical protein BASA60_005399 [Batrachochytrium salamandrivorans]KAH9250786.1 hypothetical protein BASA81_011374 [Batrachochytrium salamandrivorans]